MLDTHKEDLQKTNLSYSQQVGESESRKIRALRRSVPGVWAGLGMMGLVGWSVTIPTLACAALGIWLDNHHPGKHNWTLALIVAGLAIGCLNAWHWVANEVRAMRDSHKDADD
jgi:ATP synthase protein I